MPFLSDKRVIPQRGHWSAPHSGEPLVDTRLCDAAAEAICRHRSDLTYREEGTLAQMDAQIKRIRNKVLAEK